MATLERVTTIGGNVDQVVIRSSECVTLPPDGQNVGHGCTDSDQCGFHESCDNGVCADLPCSGIANPIQCSGDTQSYTRPHTCDEKLCVTVHGNVCADVSECSCNTRQFCDRETRICGQGLAAEFDPSTCAPLNVTCGVLSTTSCPAHFSCDGVLSGTCQPPTCPASCPDPATRLAIDDNDNCDCFNLYCE